MAGSVLEGHRYEGPFVIAIDAGFGPAKEVAMHIEIARANGCLGKHVSYLSSISEMLVLYGRQVVP